MRKNLFSFFTMSILGITFITGCSSSNIESTETATEISTTEYSDNNSESPEITTEIFTTDQDFADENFIASLSKGLEARWKCCSEDDLTIDDTGTEKEQKFLEKCIACELNELDKYTSEPFKDTDLQEKALEYINVLKDSKIALDYELTDGQKFDDEWCAILMKRSRLISEFINDYGLTVSDEYADTLIGLSIEFKDWEDLTEEEKELPELGYEQ